MKRYLFLHFILLAGMAGITCRLVAQNQDNMIWVPSYLLPNYDETGRPLPPGIPKTVDTNGKTLFITPRFTTLAYRNEALKLVIQEANKVAKELKLPEELPITQSNFAGYHIGPFDFNYSHHTLGFVETKKYCYYVARGDRFNNLTVAQYDQTCFKYRDLGERPISQLDTNAALRLAEKWLRATHMDIDKLNQDCKVHVAPSTYWNGLVHLGDVPSKKFVPIYYVWWTSPENEEHGGDSAHVELYLPTKALIQFGVEDPKYILRPPIVFTNMAALFPGVAPIYTNYPIPMTYINALPPN